MSESSELTPARCRVSYDKKWCIIENQRINRFSQFEGCHEDFILLEFSHCTMSEFPSAANVLKHMPNMKELFISHCNLSQISKDDLKGFECLTKLIVSHCDIEVLSNDLFEYTRDLEHIAFNNNKIIQIGDKIMEPLRKLDVFNLLDNLKINVIYQSKRTNGTTLDQFKNAIMRCKTDARGKQMREIQGLRERNQSLEIEVKARDRSMARDFSLTIDDKKFKVSKIVMATRCKRFARLIDENPGADDLKMGNIRPSIFEAVLEFISDGKVSDSNVNAVELFAASLKLEMEDLTTFAYHMLLDKVNPESALDVLRLCNKYGVGGELKEKAFDEYKKNFPSIKLSNYLMSDSEKLIQLMEAKMNIDGIIQGEN